MGTFGDKLRKARERKGFSQTEVFKRTKINNKTLSRYERDGSEPDFETLKILANLYEVRVEELIGVNEKTNYIEETISDKEKNDLLNLIVGITDPDKKKAAIEYLKFLAGQK